MEGLPEIIGVCCDSVSASEDNTQVIITKWKLIVLNVQLCIIKFQDDGIEIGGIYELEEEEDGKKVKKMTKSNRGKMLKKTAKADGGKKLMKKTKTDQRKKLKKTVKKAVETKKMEPEESGEEEREEPPAKKPRSSFELPAGFTVIKKKVPSKIKPFNEYLGPDGTNFLR